MKELLGIELIGFGLLNKSLAEAGAKLSPPSFAVRCVLFSLPLSDVELFSLIFDFLILCFSSDSTDSFAVVLTGSSVRFCSCNLASFG